MKGQSFMAKTAQIKCVNKSDRDNPWERITDVGGLNADGFRWRQSQEKTIRDIESGEWRFYVSVRGDSVLVVVAESRFGNKYLKTEPDGDQPNNLLSLTECPR